MSTTNNVTVFLDTIGRIIIGEVVSQDKTTTKIQNPAVVHIQTQPQTNQLQLQILPLFFREFLADRNVPTVWSFKNENIAPSEGIELSPQFIAQYKQGFAPITAAPASNENKPVEVVKLFDEEESK